MRVSPLLSSLFLISSGVRTLAAAPLDVWHPRYASGDVNGVEFVDGAFWFLTSSGQIIRSPDGASWSLIETGQTNGLRALIKTGGKWVAVGDNGAILSSLDGMSWTPRVSGTTSRLSDIVERSGEFAAVGDNGTILISPDGESWQPRASGRTDNLRAIVADDQKYVVAGRGGALLSSPDARTWTSHVSPTTDHLYGLAWGAGQYVAVGTNGTVVTSTDGVNWVRRRTGGRILFAVAYGQGQFVAVGMSAPISATSRIMTSTDGVNWVERTSPSYNSLYAVVYANDRFVAGGVSGTILESQTGSNWAYSPLPGAAVFSGVTYANNMFVAMGGQAYISADGISWTAYTVGLPQSLGAGKALAFGGDKFIAAGRSGTVATSPDAKKWTLLDLDTFSDVATVDYVHGRFFAAGNEGFLASSTDAANWTNHRTHAYNRITGVAWGNGLFMALSLGGHLMTSRDGQTWALSRMVPSGGGLAFGNGRFVIAGSGDYVTTSDGLSFETSRKTGGNSITQLIYGNGIFFGVGIATVVSSIDGITWTNHVAPFYDPSVILTAATFGSDRVTLAGDESHIWQSDSISPPALTLFAEPKSVFVKEGSDVLLSVGATGHQPLLYQWRRNGLAIPDQTNSWWELQSTSLAAASEYTVVIRNAQGTLTSKAATVEIEPRAVPLDYWHLRNSTAELKPLLKLAYGVSTYAAIDDDGAMRLSPDGVHWKVRSLNLTERLTNVRWVYGTFMAVGERGTIAFSTDAASWSVANVPVDVTLTDVTWGNGTYVAVGDKGVIFTSTDRLLWTARSSFASERLNAVTFSAGLFAAVGNSGTVLTSPNGTNWNSEFAETLENLVAVTGGTVFLAAGENETLLVRNRTSWVDEYTSFFLISPEMPKDRTFALFLNGQYYVGGPGFGERRMLSLTGGTSSSPFTSPRQISEAVAVGGTIVGVGIGGAIIPLFPARVPDFLQLSHLRGVQSNGSILVCVGRSGELHISVDGFRWIKAESGTTNHLSSLAYANARFVAVGENATIITSTDGIQWNRINLGFTNSLLRVVAGDNRFVAVGSGRTILYSSDGVVWSGTTGLTNNPSLLSLTFGKGIFLGADRFNLWGSTDGISWERRTLPTQSAPSLNSVAYGNGTFLAIGSLSPNGSRFFMSSDGMSWSQLTPQLPTRDLTLKFVGDHFIAFGRDGRIFTSTDFVRWLERPSTTHWDLYDAVAFKNTFVTVGDYGTILQSDPLTDTSPQFVSQPLAQRVAVGESMVLKVNVSGTSPLNYQWRFNGVAIPGATNAPLSFTNVTTSVAGRYEVVVNNPVGSSLSDTAIVSVGSDGSTPVRLEARIAGENRLELILSGALGTRYEIQYSEELSPATVWRSLTTVTLTSESIVVADAIISEQPTKFYRAVLTQ